MTDEELDLLASSFLDGEATPEEVAMIERDPALQARVEELRVAQAAARGPVPRPSMQVKEDHLAAALAEFDMTDRQTMLMAVDEPPADAITDGTDPDHPVIDLRAHRAEREQRQAEAAGRMRWLSAVAGVMVFAAGAVFLVSQVGGGGDDGEFATDAPTAETEASDSAEAAQMAPAGDDTAADAVADDGSDAAIASEAMGDADAEAELTMDDAEESADESAADAEPGDEASNEPLFRDFAEEGFFGDEPVVSYSMVPTSDELLAEVDLPWRTPESSMCADSADLPDGAEVIGYLPIEIPAPEGAGSDTRVVEALYLTLGTEARVLLVDSETCTVI